MITAPALRSLLDGLARRFENRPQPDKEYEHLGAWGWGQFLDGQPRHNQVGPFGTCSGIIARALANRGPDRLDQHVNILINQWWTSRSESKSHAKFLGQTIRLAMLHLAIRLKNESELSALQKEIESTILGNVRPDKMWGNYLMPGEIEDPSPRLIATSLVVLSFTLFRSTADPCPDVLTEAVKKIEDRLLGSEELPRLHVAIASAAILSLPNYNPSSKVRSRISKLAYATQISMPELGVYFYDYEYVESERSDSDNHSFKTDYFIVPTELVLGIAGYQPKAPIYLRFRSENTLKLLVQNLQGFDGYYRPDNEQRISSVNQCWVAMYLALAEQTVDSKAPRSSILVRPIPRLWYGVIKQRPDHFWIDSTMLCLCAVGLITGSLLPFSGFTFENIVAKVCTAVLAFLAGRLYAPIFLKRVFMERE